MKIRLCQPNDDAAWDAFVLAHPLGTPFHTTAWRRVVEETFRYLPRYLLAEDGGRIVAVLPMFFVDTMLTGKVLLSTPFAVYGGILALERDQVHAIHRHIVQMGEELNVQHVELRNRSEDQCANWARVDRYVTFTTRIGDSEESILAALPRETRRMTRRAVEQNYSIRATRDLKPFEDLYLKNLRKLGTPAFPHRYFVKLLEHFPDAEIQEVLLDGAIAAAVFSFYFRDQVLPYYGASDPAYNRANPNNYMYYRLMLEARERGCGIFDFGRSKRDSGSHLFKSHWGMEEVALPYEIHLVRRKEMPNFSPANPKYKMGIRMWRKMPLWLTRWIGPRLLRMVP